MTLQQDIGVPVCKIREIQGLMQASCKSREISRVHINQIIRQLFTENIRMKRTLLVLVTLLFCSGCMYSPFIGEEVEHKSEEFFFSGWLEDPNKTVDVQIS